METSPRRGPAACAHPVDEGDGREWAAHQLALRHVAADRAEDAPGFCVLDSFGDHLESHVVPEVDRGANDDEIVRGGFEQRQHERLVDLELVDRQSFEMSERRVAGTVVIDRETHAAALEVAQNRESVSGIPFR